MCHPPPAGEITAIWTMRTWYKHNTLRTLCKGMPCSNLRSQACTHALGTEVHNLPKHATCISWLRCSPYQLGEWAMHARYGVQPQQGIQKISGVNSGYFKTDNRDWFTALLIMFCDATRSLCCAICRSCCDSKPYIGLPQLCLDCPNLRTSHHCMHTTPQRTICASVQLSPDHTIRWLQLHSLQLLLFPANCTITPHVAVTSIDSNKARHVQW
jgi:hypothetical protein